jgi:hypothetical protein
MNPKIEEVQLAYRSSRSAANYSIFDLENILKELADAGVIWMLQGMKDLTDAESILIKHYLYEKRELQNYDLN